MNSLSEISGQSGVDFDAQFTEQIRAAFPASLDVVTLHALAKDPADRYQSASEMRDDINRLLNGQAVHAVPPTATSTPTSRTSTRGGRRRAPSRADGRPHQRTSAHASASRPAPSRPAPARMTRRRR